MALPFSTPSEKQTLAPPNSVPGNKRVWVYCLLCLLFVLSRINILFSNPPYNDAKLYGTYMFEELRAKARGLTVHQFRVRQVDGVAAVLRQRGESTTSVDWRRHIEYPPLAMAFLRLASYGIPQPSQEDLLSNVQSDSFGLTPERFYADDYACHYALLLVLVDAILFVLLLRFHKRLYPNGSIWDQLRRPAVYLVSTGILWAVLFTRLDLMLALLITASLFSLVSSRNSLWSSALLATAINFKLVPLIVVPIWLVGSLPVEAKNHLLRGRTLLVLRGAASSYWR